MDALPEITFFPCHVTPLGESVHVRARALPGPLQGRLAPPALQFLGHPQIARSGLPKSVPENAGLSASSQRREFVSLFAKAFREIYVVLHLHAPTKRNPYDTLLG
jgi:hypothetical protein